MPTPTLLPPGGHAVTAPAGPHAPVLRERVTALLAEEGPGLLIDATVGAAGHAEALLEASGPEVVLLALDRDPRALGLARERLAPFGYRATVVAAAFDELAAVRAEQRPDLPVRGVLYDLGVSSMQLDEAERGFSWRAEAPLDMRMDPAQERTAADVVNATPQAELVALLAAGGEDRYPRRIARAIVAARPLRTTRELAEVVAAATPPAQRHGRTHPATRTFQALRIAVNAELERFRASLPQALELLEPARADRRGGRVAVLAYHSGEDRLAKRLLAEAARGCICPPDLPVCGCGRVPALTLLTRGAEQPPPEETAVNPRARSARLRVAERTAAPLPEDLDADHP